MHNRPSIRLACELGSNRGGESQWPAWQPQQEPPSRISLWKNRSGGERMSFTSSEEINPAQNSMIGSKLRKRFSWLGKKPGTKRGAQTKGLLLPWLQLKPGVNDIPLVVNEALEIASVT